jgi:hypothetical protein
MKEISELLACYTDREGRPTRGMTAEEVKVLYARLWTEFEDSDVGQKLFARGGPDVLKRVMELYTERYATSPPTVTPVFEALEEIGSDLLLELPEPAPPKAALKVTRKVVATPEPRKLRQEVSAFAKLYNAQILLGVHSVKPKAGYVTLMGYDFPAAKAKILLDEALELDGLIR